MALLADALDLPVDTFVWMAALAHALNLPKGERARKVAQMQYQELRPLYEKSWPPQIPPVPGHDVTAFGRAFVWASYWNGANVAIRDHDLPRGLKRVALARAAVRRMKQTGRFKGDLRTALAAGKDVESAYRYATQVALSLAERDLVDVPEPFDRGQVGLVRDIHRVLMVQFVDEKENDLSRGRQRGGGRGEATPYQTACDAVVLGELFQEHVFRMISREYHFPDIAYVMELLLAYTPGMEAVKGIVEKAEEEARAIVIAGPAGMRWRKDRFEASVGRLRDAIPDLKKSDPAGNGGDMPRFAAIINNVSRYWDLLPSGP